MPSQEMIDKHGKRLAYYIYHKKKGTLKSQKKKGKKKLSAEKRARNHANYMKVYD